MMSYKQAEVLGMWCSYQEAMPRCTSRTEELPRPSQDEAPRGRQRRPRLCRFRTLPLTFDEIQEVVEEEGASPSEEERARRAFLQSLESLRRSTQNLHLNREKLSSSSTSSLDSGDSDSVL